MKWYKRDPEAFAGGTAELSLEEVGAYTRVIDLIYSRDGNVPDDEMFLARALRCDVRVWRRIRTRLIATGKISTSAGLIVNLRATSEISYAQVRMKKDLKRNENKPTNLTSDPILTTTTTTTKKKVSTGTRKRVVGVETPLPDNWQPSNPVASEDRLELERFRLHAKAKGRVQVNWNAAWAQWKISPYRKTGVVNGTPREDRHSLSAAFDKLDAALDEQIAVERGEVEAGDLPFPPNLRLISG